MMRIKNSLLFNVLVVLSIIQYTFNWLIPIPSIDSFFSQLDDLWILFSVFIAFVTKCKSEVTFLYHKTILDYWLICLLIYFPVAVVLNGSPLLNALLSFKSYFLVWLVFYYIVWSSFVNEKFIYRTINLIMILFYFELLLQTFQIFSSFVKGGWGDDVATGTFSGANTLSYAYFFPLFFVTYLFLIEKEKQYLIKTMSFFSGMIMSWGMFAIMTFPFVFLSFTFTKIVKKKKLVNRILLGISIVFGLLIISQHLNGSQSELIEKYGPLGFFSPSFVINKFSADEFDVSQGSARLLWFPVTIERLNEYAYSPWIGMGPGMYASYTANRLMPEPNMSIYNMFHQLESGLDADIDSQIIPIWGEFGYIGISMTIIFLLYMSFTFFKIHQKLKKTKDKAISLTASAGSIYLLVGMYVNHVLESQQIMILYIIFCASAYKLFILTKK